MTSLIKQQSDLISKISPLKECEYGTEWPDYAECGLTKDRIPDLIELAINGELLWDDEREDYDADLWFAPIHAWRALAQLKATEAIGPLINCFEDYVECCWALEELPVVIGMIGIEAIKPLTKKLLDSQASEDSRTMAESSLTEIAKQNSEDKEIFDRIVNILSSYVADPDKDKLDLNGMVSASLCDLNEIHKIPTQTIDIIRNLYQNDLAALEIMGDIEDVEMQFGIREKRDTPAPKWFQNDKLLTLEDIIANENSPATSNKIGRNDLCPCNSGKKYKKCCLLEQE